MGENGWNEWSKHILAELERLNDKTETLDEKMTQVLVEISSLKVKAGIWGGIAGMVPVLVVLGGLLIKHFIDLKP